MVDRLRIIAKSGRVEVTGESRDDVAVEGATATVATPELLVHGSSETVIVRAPEGTDVMVGSASGDVDLDGPLGAVSVTTGSADVRADEIASIDARTVSGRLDVGHSAGTVRLKATSANVHVGRADGDVRVATVSGDVDVAEAADGVSIKTVSGSIDVTVTGHGRVSAETVSGSIRIHVADGLRPDVRLRTISGKRRVECETGSDFELVARTISGNITVAPA